MQELTRTETAVDVCEREVRRWILSGEMRPGERLPPERLLATRLGVNRTTLRGALTRLASARLLTVRQGSGYVVQDYRRVAGLELLPELAQNASNGRLESLARDLLEVRRRLIQMVIERVGERARPEDVAAVATAVTQLEHVAHAQAPLEQIAAADLDVMAAILAATRSSVLGLSLNPVLFVVRELAPLREAIYSDPAGHVTAHRLLLAWLEHPTQEAADAVLAELERRDRATIERITSRVEIPS
jgi:GntR family transcriptional regulator, transcriptional repressor for pyruvate dehydrogenase complex